MATDNTNGSSGSESSTSQAATNTNNGGDTDSGGDPDIEVGPVRDADTGEVIDPDPTDTESGASGTSDAASLAAGLREGSIDAEQAEQFFEEGGQGLTREQEKRIQAELGQEKLEKRLRESGDIPRQTQGRNVFVTGGPGTGQPQRQVGAGGSRIEAALEAATDRQGFDAFEGTQINRFEEAIGTDRGAEREDIVTAEGPTGVLPGETTAEARRAPRQDQEFEVVTSRERQRQAQQDQQQIVTPQGIENIQGFEPETQAERRLVQNARRADLDLSGPSIDPLQELREGDLEEASLEATLAGFEAGEEVSQAVTSTIEDIQTREVRGLPVGETVTDVVAPTNELTRGFALAEEAAEAGTAGEFDPLETLQIASPQVTSEEETQTQRELAGAGTQETIEAASIAAGAPGTVSALVRDEERSVGSALAGGATLFAEQAERQGVGQTFTEEVGGELLNPLIIAPTATVTPDVTGSVSPRVAETEAFIRGDLGTRATETRGAIDIEQTEVLRRDTQTEEGRRVQAVEGRRFTEGGTELGTGTVFRFEEPVTRRQFLRERLGLQDQTLAEAINIEGNAIGSGVGAFVPPETTPETDTTPDTTPESIDQVESIDDLFGEPEGRGTTFVEQASTPDIRTPVPETTQETEQGFETETSFTEEQRQETPPEQIQEQTPETQEQTISEITPELLFETEQLPGQETQTRPERFTTPEPETTSLTTSTGLETGTEEVSELFTVEEEEIEEEDLTFTPTVRSAALGITTEVTEEEAEQLQEEQVFTGLGQRGILEITDTESDEEQDLRSDLGI